MLSRLSGEIKQWRYEWFPLAAFVVILVTSQGDVAFWLPWLFGLCGLFVLAWCAGRMTRRTDQLDKEQGSGS
jgi:Sec-independent protein secretion pathway component TatC